MTDHGDRQRIRPTLPGRAELLDVVEAAGPLHVLDLGTLGEYAELVGQRGQAEADRQLPEVAAHLATGCTSCGSDLAELTAMLAADEAEAPHPPAPSPSRERGGALAGPDHAHLSSGIHAADLPDPRLEEADAAARARRAHLRRIWLVAAVAALVAVVGLTLVVLALLAARAPAPSSPGRTLPTNGSCPASHPIKGNRPSMIYHAPGGELYGATRPEECFASPADAQAAGYRPSQR